MKALFINFTEYYRDSKTRRFAFSYLHADIKKADLIHPEKKEIVQILMTHCYQFERKYKFSIRRSRLAKAMIEAL